MTQTVIIYGNSLVASSIGASLQGCAELQLLSLDPALPDAQQRLSAAQPDVVIFDLATEHPEVAIALWKMQPHLLLIGVDLTKDHTLVLSSQETRVLSTGDLLQVIASHTGDVSQPPGRPKKPKATPV